MRKVKRSKLELRGVLIGIVLGDGFLTKVSSKQNSCLRIDHCLKQKDYCEHKLKLITNLLDINYNLKERTIHSSQTQKTYYSCQGMTNVHRYFTKLRKLLYDDKGKKVLTSKILNYLTPEGIAYWLMDDGGVAFNHKRKFINGLFISTQCFSHSEHLLIKEYFISKYGIDCKIHTHGNGKYRIFFNKGNSIKLLSLIDKFKHKDLVYKFTVDYKEYVNLTEE